jgi:hypothetical protein
MRERSEQVLRIACMVLGALVVLQLVLWVARRDPLAHLSMPPLPALTNAPESQSGKANAVTAHPALNTPSNQVSGQKGALDTNSVKATNTALVVVSGKTVTNAASVDKLAAKAGSNHLASAGSSSGGITSTGTVVIGASNVLAKSKSDRTTNSVVRAASTNAVVAGAKGASNSIVKVDSARAGTNVAARPRPPQPVMGPPGLMAAGNRPKAMPPSIQARVDRIIDSELLGPVMRPLPMALLGIAGDTAFIRAPSGQTGLIKEGDKLGEIKLIQIGVNRVLVEEEGQKKELTMFSGYGSESLLSKTQESPK